MDIPELNLKVRLTRGRVAPWMYRGRIHRTGLANLDLEACEVVVRNRRPGDRIQPLGTSKRRRLKDVLIDRRIPRPERDRLPLLVVDGEIAWVPGVTIGERFRLGHEPSVAPEGDRRNVWVAEVEALRAPSDNPLSLHHEEEWDDRSTER